jgi:hypothetical protein
MEENISRSQDMGFMTISEEMPQPVNNRAGKSYDIIINSRTDSIELVLLVADYTLPVASSQSK